MTWSSTAIAVPGENGRAGRSARGPTRPARASYLFGRRIDRPPTQGQGQDFRLHARPVRERAGSGFAGQASAEVQAQDRPGNPGCRCGCRASFLLR